MASRRGEYAPDLIRRHRPACDASLQRLGIERSTSITSTRTIENVPLADSLGAFDGCAKTGKIRAIGLSQFTAPRLEEAMRRQPSGNGLTSRARCRPGTIWSSARSSRASCATPRCASASASFRSTASPTASSPASTEQGRPRQKPARRAQSPNISKARGMRVLDALDEIAAETGAALGDDRACLDHGPARIAARSPARPASSS